MAAALSCAEAKMILFSIMIFPHLAENPAPVPMAAL